MQSHIVSKTVIVGPDDKLLVLRRSADDTHRPGGFDFPGGKVDDGEAIVAGAIREISEEAGLNLAEDSLKLIYAVTKVGYQNEEHADINFVWLGFIAKLPSNQKVKLSHEHQSFEWLSLADAILTCESASQQGFLHHIEQYSLLSEL